MKGRWTGLAIPLGRPRWLAVFLGLCAVAAAGGYFFWTYWDAEDHRRQALTAMDDRDFERAQSHLHAFLAARPDDAEAHFLLAQACRRARVEVFPEAHRSLQEARRLGWPGVDVARESMMLEIQEQGADDDRTAALRPTLDSGGAAAAALALEALTRGCLLDNRLTEANAWLNAWVDLAPDDWYPRLWRGALFAYTGHANLAVADFDCVLKKRPGDEEVRKRLGLALTESGYDYAAALKYLESYRRRSQDDADALVGIAQCQRSLGRPEEAEAVLRPVVAAHADHVDALLTLALAESDRGDDRDALQQLRRLEPLARQYHEPEELERLRRLEPAPDHADISHRTRTVLNLLATVLRRLGRIDEARRYEAEVEQAAADYEELKKALAENSERPHDGACLDRVGVLYLKIGMTDAGKACLEQALRVNPDDPVAHRALADYYAGRDDPDSRRLAAEHRRLAGSAP